MTGSAGFSGRPTPGPAVGCKADMVNAVTGASGRRDRSGMLDGACPVYERVREPGTLDGVLRRTGSASTACRRDLGHKKGRTRHGNGQVGVQRIWDC